MMEIVSKKNFDEDIHKTLSKLETYPWSFVQSVFKDRGYTLTTNADVKCYQESVEQLKRENEELRSILCSIQSSTEDAAEVIPRYVDFLSRNSHIPVDVTRLIETQVVEILENSRKSSSYPLTHDRVKEIDRLLEDDEEDPCDCTDCVY